MLAGCAGAPVTPQSAKFFSDRSFSPPSQRINADDIFAVTPAMKHYLHTEIADQLLASGRQHGLFDALYRKDQLKLEYDSTMTRTASQAFAARTGNCLSLVIMTAALAKELGMAVHYQRVYTDEAWNRSDGIFFASGHVNLTLGKRNTDSRIHFDETHLMTIDFYPVAELEVQHAWTIEEKTIVAMYMNNRAAETLVQGQLNDAYWWAREAIIRDPGFISAYNTLGVIYRRHHNLREAEQVLEYVLQQEPQNAQALSNLILVMDDGGRSAESAVLARKLLQIEPYPPYHFFMIGQKAMRAQDFQTARDQFAREIKREPTNPEFNFWLAAAYIGLGETKLAQKYLTAAIENSTTRGEHDLYAAKLDRIKSHNNSAGGSGS
jgi:Tfp pilus assembly protein PilF